MEIGRRDAFDLVLVAVSLALVYAHAVRASDPQAVVGLLVGRVTSISPVVYLVLVGSAGVLLLVYNLLYLPAKQSR
jgi:hypothetical protein